LSVKDANTFRFINPLPPIFANNLAKPNKDSLIGYIMMGIGRKEKFLDIVDRIPNVGFLG
jgi:hypothetical protein